MLWGAPPLGRPTVNETPLCCQMPLWGFVCLFDCQPIALHHPWWPKQKVTSTSFNMHWHWQPWGFMPCWISCVWPQRAAHTHYFVRVCTLTSNANATGALKSFTTWGPKHTISGRARWSVCDRAKTCQTHACYFVELWGCLRPNGQNQRPVRQHATTESVLFCRIVGMSAAKWAKPGACYFVTKNC